MILVRILFTIILWLVLFTAHAQIRKVQMKEYGGVYLVPCVVNNLPMDFIYDTGASGILISNEAAQMMAAKGALESSDIIGKTQSQIANGDIVDGLLIKLRSFSIGGAWVSNLNAQVSLSLNAPLLLGTDVLERFGSVTTDYNQKLLLLGDEKNSFLEAANKMFRLHKYVWGSASSDIEALEESEKHRMKLVTGQYTDYKSRDGSLKYKIRVAGLVLGKNYGFDNGKLNIEMYRILQEGFMPGNPDMECYDLPLNKAYTVYSKLDSIIKQEASVWPYYLCFGKGGFECVNNPTAEAFVYDRFFSASKIPVEKRQFLGFSSQHEFESGMSSLLKEARSANAIGENDPIQLIQRRMTFNKDGYYELNVSTTNGIDYDVWVVVRQKVF